MMSRTNVLANSASRAASSSASASAVRMSVEDRTPTIRPVTSVTGSAEM